MNKSLSYSIQNQGWTKYHISTNKRLYIMIYIYNIIYIYKKKYVENLKITIA